MSAKDLDEVLEIERQSFPKPWTRGMFESELKNPVSFSTVLRADSGGEQKLVAYMVYWVVHGEAHILNIAVDPGLRRRGAAELLLGASLEQMRRNQVYEVFLEVRRSNVAARNLYAYFGFRESFERKNYYGDEDAIVMTLTFDGYGDEDE
ncbi:MAG TPA: ribosomal protein S18-alanine N-acetyltransferase [Thermodesulfobacteriota bacterium]|nr:ribosomal protein S18-alanine N-acetyltransferase [Thermodesulfobacteriota bacterium]